jgi:hypothetical protein
MLVVMISNINEILPIDIINSYETLKFLRDSKDEWRYKFMDESKFAAIEDPKLCSSIYWSEMLSRTYIVTLVSSFKTLRWIEAMDNNYNNYYGFCSSLRGLIESVSDTFYTLRQVPLTIALDFKVIKEQINNNSNVLITHASLESELLHYIQATKLNKEQKENNPKSYNAKQVREYLKSINDPDDKLLFLYDYLCGIAHPAYEANQLFLFLHNDEAIVCSDSINYEQQLINALLEENGETLSRLCKIYMNNLTSVWLILNQFKIDCIHSEINFEFEFKKTELWKEVNDLIIASDKKYSEAIINGKYQ